MIKIQSNSVVNSAVNQMSVWRHWVTTHDVTVALALNITVCIVYEVTLCSSHNHCPGRLTSYSRLFKNIFIYVMKSYAVDGSDFYRTLSFLLLQKHDGLTMGTKQS